MYDCHGWSFSGRYQPIPRQSAPVCLVRRGRGGRLACDERFSCRGVWGGLSVRYYLDPATRAPHIHEHGVFEDEVEEVLGAPGEDRAGRDGSRVALGQTRAGRYLRVIYAPETGGGDLFVITAYELRGKPLSAYRRALKKGKRR